MLSLPVEVWSLILGHLVDFQIVDVSKTCVFLRDVAETFIYATTKLTCHYDALDLAHTLQRRPDVGRLVRHLAHHPRNFDMPGDQYSFSTHPVFARCSALLPNLQTLDLGLFNVDAAFCAAVVANWPRLHTLRLSRCSVAKNIPAGALVRSALTTLIIAEPNRGQAYYHRTPHHGYRWDILIPPAQLHTLTLHTTSDMDLMLKKVFPRHPNHLSALTSLTISGTFFSLPVQQLLVNTPSLQRLSMRRLSPADDQLPLRPELIPDLEYFEGPARCMPVYVRGRPVNTVKIHTYDHWGNTPAEDFLRTLGESTSPVTQLVLNDRPNYNINLTVMMSHVPPSLESLGFDRMRRTDVANCLAGLPPLPVLRSVEVDDVRSGYVPGGEMLANLSRASFPNLQKTVVNEKTWLLGDGDLWKEVEEEIRWRKICEL